MLIIFKKRKEKKKALIDKSLGTSPIIVACLTIGPRWFDILVAIRSFIAALNLMGVEIDCAFT